MSEDGSNMHEKRFDATGAAVEGPENDDPWGIFPSQERQDKLDLRLAEWTAMSDSDKSTLLGPFNWDWGKNFWLSGADVFYLAARALVRSDCTIADARVRLRHPTVYQHVYLPKLNLRCANLRDARLEGAVLRKAHLERAVLSGAHLESANLWRAHLEGADLTGAYFDAATVLRETNVTDSNHGTVSVADVRWGGVNLAILRKKVTEEKVEELPAGTVLGDETAAEKLARDSESQRKTRNEGGREEVLKAFRRAARAYSQFSAAMRDQGMSDKADDFAYRAQVMQRKVLRLEGRHSKWMFWWFLQGLAGYGYRPQFTLVCYMIVLIVSVALYCWQGTVFAHPHVFTPGILGTSIVDAFTALHGRGFFPTPAESGWQMATAAFDAVAGLIVEASFIATFVQRFFGK